MSFDYKGYAGRYLRINLTDGKVKKEPLPKWMAKDYIGGTGFAAKILWDETKPETNPLGPENRLVIAVGPATGAFAPSSGRYMMAAKSPLTDIWGESHCGGHFGPELKYAGYDMVILHGRSEKPVYLSIDDDWVELKDASHLWGKDTRETTRQIRDEIGDETARVSCIGLAGENLVRYAAVMTDYYRAAGRTGMGAVMGSKNLKAIAVRGTKDVEVADPEKYVEVMEEVLWRNTEGPWAEPAQDSLGTYGTTNLVDLVNAIGRLPTKNHWTGYYEDAEKIGPEAIRSGYRIARDSCFSCLIQCKYLSNVDAGPYAGTFSGGPEYESVFALGSNCLVNDIEAILHANMLCNLYGMDTISVGKCISFAMECYEQGLLSRGQVDDLDLRWGNAEAMTNLIHKIAQRKGFGDLLAEGVRRASRKIGRKSERFAMHVKGLEMSGQDPRAHKSSGCTHAISVRGADHLRSLSCIDEQGFYDIAVERFGADRAKEVCDLLSEKYKGYIVKDQEDLFAIVDSVLMCKYGTMWPPMYYFDFIAKLLPPLTGIKEYSNVKNLRLTAERICNLRRCFNVREGITRKDETLPSRFTEQPMPSGPAKGQICHLEPMLKEYYEARGWDAATALPFREALERVGLKDVADQLESTGKVLRKGG